MKYLTQEQVNALFDAIPKSGNVTAIRDLAIFRIGYHHGLRAGEMGLLQLSDVNEARGRIHIRRLKRSNSGDYALLTAETKALRAWLKLRGRKPGPLFPSRKRKGISQQMLDVLMKGYGQLAELPRELRHFHSLKHSCATHLLEQGRDIVEVQDWLGHRNIANTMIYAQYTNPRRQRMSEEVRDWAA